jgi:hypothetical protein
MLWLALLALPSLILLPWNIIAAVVATGAIYAVIEHLAQRQELDADRFAANGGYGRELLAYVMKIGPPPLPPTFYPDYETRCTSLERTIEEKQHAAKTA